MSLRDHLEDIRTKHGSLTPQLVVEEARDPEHPLHDKVFDCPPDEAAERYYVSKAHRLIQIVKLDSAPGDNAPSVRAYQAVRTDQGYVYEPSEHVAADEFTRRLVLADMEREWKAMKARYERFAEFADMILRDMAA